MRRLTDPEYLAFPFRMDETHGADGRVNARPATSRRSAHVREQVEQVLFTNPPERVFRPEFGAGLKQLVFAPNSSPLWDLTQSRLSGALMEALQGEVDPGTLAVEIEGEGESLRVTVRYVLAPLGETDAYELAVGVKGHG